MSRIGKKPIPIPSGVKVGVINGVINVEGPKGKISFAIPPLVSYQEKDGKIFFTANEESKAASSLHGTIRAVTANMIAGVTSGFAKTLVIEGVGYKAQVQGKNLKLNVGFSHPVEYLIPEGIKIDASKQVEVLISGVDKVKVGQVAAEIRDICPPEPYKGKGIRYKDERIRRKVGKAVTK